MQAEGDDEGVMGFGPKSWQVARVRALAPGADVGTCVVVSVGCVWWFLAKRIVTLPCSLCSVSRTRGRRS